MKINLRKSRSLLLSIPYGIASLYTLLAVLATTSVFSQSPRFPIAQHIKCDYRQSMVEIRNCIWLSYQASQKWLNEVDKQLVAKFSGEERSILVESQLEWIKFRDKTCKFEVYKNRGGNFYPALLNLCLDGMTRVHTAELEKVLKKTTCESASTTAGFNRCMRLNYEASDKRLNQVYKQLMSKLSLQEGSTLIKIQNQWIKLRDRDCNFEVSIIREGSGYIGVLNHCLERKTTERTAELQSR